MLRRFLLLAFALCFLWGQSQQPIIQIDNRTMSFPIMDQEEINRMASPAEGFVVMNKTTNCINYFINKHWFQQCGSCLPETSPYIIDSTRQVANALTIYFKKGETDTIHFKIGDETLSTFDAKNSVTLRIPLNTDTVALESFVSNSCYTRQRYAYKNIALKKVNGSAPYSMKAGEQTLLVRNINGTIWMCKDINSTTPNTKLTERFVFYSENQCPAGWKIPSKKDWTQLMSFYTSSPAEIFEPADSGNVSIELNMSGAYSVEEKRIIGENTMASYWVNDTDASGKQYLINVTTHGYMFVSEKKEKAKLSLRCIKYE